jgi:hypothetical protein
MTLIVDTDRQRDTGDRSSYRPGALLQISYLNGISQIILELGKMTKSQD